MLRREHPDLWGLLMKWDKDSPFSFKPRGITVHHYDKRFKMEDEGEIKPHDKSFRWRQVLSDIE